MDRFVVQLEGRHEEVIRRRSLESAATMKEQGTTIKRCKDKPQSQVFLYNILQAYERYPGEKTDGQLVRLPSQSPHTSVFNMHCNQAESNNSVVRSVDYDPNQASLGGETFVLLAVVTDAEDGVNEGADGVEHMSVILIVIVCMKCLQDMWPQVSRDEA